MKYIQDLTTAELSLCGKSREYDMQIYQIEKVNLQFVLPSLLLSLHAFQAELILKYEIDEKGGLLKNPSGVH